MAELISIKKADKELKIYKVELKSYCQRLKCNLRLKSICSAQEKEIACNPLFDLLELERK